MAQTIRLAVALVVVGVSTVAGCDPRGGGDPRGAPACDLNAYRCDGDMLQICQVDAAERRKTWWDVHDCVEFGHDVGKALTCVERGAGAPAGCAEAIPEAGAAVDGGDAGAVEDCPLGEWRCHDGVVQACGRDAQWGGTTWWDVQNCNELGNEIGEPIVCVETDAGLGAGCDYVEPGREVAHEDE